MTGGESFWEWFAKAVLAAFGAFLFWSHRVSEERQSRSMKSLSGRVAQVENRAETLRAIERRLDTLDVDVRGLKEASRATELDMRDRISSSEATVRSEIRHVHERIDELAKEATSMSGTLTAIHSAVLSMSKGGGGNA